MTCGRPRSRAYELAARPPVGAGGTERDPDSAHDQVAALLREMEEKGGQPISQIASTVGDDDVTVHTAGSGNTTIVR